MSDIRMPSSGIWRRLKPPAHAGSSLADFSTLKMEAIRSSETLVHTSYTRCHIQKTAFFIVTAVNISNLTCQIVTDVSDECTASIFWGSCALKRKAAG
jgi:hypothetical protein